MAFSSSATSLTRLGGYELFMCIVQKPPERERSFEELRVEDYLKAYVATARPPPPVPDQPDTPKAREALGLPPLFRPIPAESSPSASISALPVEKPVTSLSDLPTTQIFHMTKADLNDQFQIITAQITFSFFSFEELRVHAYLSGKTMPLVTPPSEMVSLDIAPASRVTCPFYDRDTAATAFASASVDPGSPESYMSITTSPKFNKHSFEELRIAYLLGGKELTSSEIPASGSLPVATAPSLGRPRGETLSIVTPVPSFRF